VTAAQTQSAQAPSVAASAPVPGRPGKPAGIVDRHPARPVPGTLHALQRHAGNSDLQRTINVRVAASALLRCGTHPCDCPAEVRLRAELSVSHPQDPAEREADRVADEVTRGPAGYPGPIQPAPADVLPARPARPPDGPGTDLSALIDDACRRGGQPLPPESRDFMEGRFCRDFSGVRVHADPAAGELARQVGARAFTTGNHVFFAAGEFRPGGEAGQHLLAHELTHVLQRRGAVDSRDHAADGRGLASGLPVVTAPMATVQRQADDEAAAANVDPALLPALNAEIDAAAEGMGQNTDLMLRARASRMHLLLTWSGRPPLRTQDDLNAFLDQSRKLSLGEIETLSVFTPPGVELALAGYPQGFPLTWSGRVHEALSLGSDPQAILDVWRKSLDDLMKAAGRLGPEIFLHGLPIPLEKDPGPGPFRLQLSLAGSGRASPVRDYARQGVRYMQLKWVSSFAFAWEQLANDVAGAVADGKLVPGYADWKNFVDNKQPILWDLPARAADRLANNEAEVKAIQSDALKLADGALFVGMTSALFSLFGILSGWNDVSGLFDGALGRADAMVADSSAGSHMVTALRWARDNDYFWGAAAEWARNMIDHAPEVLEETVKLVVLGMIPGVDIAVAAYLIFTVARDVIGLLDELTSALNDVLGARNVLEMQKASQRLARILVNGGITILIVLATWGIGKAVARLRARAAELRAADATLTEEAAQQKAFRELSPEERAPFESRPARIATKFKELASVCELGSIRCRSALPDPVLQEAGAYPKEAGVPRPRGPFNVQKAILSLAERGTEALREICRTERHRWPEFDLALARAEKKGLDWPVDAAGSPWEVHHVKPVFMGGGSDVENLFPLPRATHQLYTNWWGRIHAAFKGRFAPDEWDEIYWSDRDVPGSRVPKQRVR
jgi:Domain of unknown function (DUF4157)